MSDQKQDDKKNNQEFDTTNVAHRDVIHSERVGGDKITVGDIQESLGIAIGTGASVNIHNYNYPQSCPQWQSSQRALELTLGLVSTELERVSAELSEEKAAKLEEIRELERKGKVQTARIRVEELRHSANWNVFTKALQAKIFRMLAGYAIADDDVNKAGILVDQARQLDPDTDTTLIQSLIRYRTTGVHAALAGIGNVGDVSVFNLKLTLLLEINRSDEAIAAIQAIPEGIKPNAETHRLHALALLSEGNVPSAQRQIQEAVVVSSHWETIREAEAIINYFSALSPVALPRRTFPQPEPVDRSFVKQDDESLQHLRKAEAEFAGLTSETERGNELRQYWQVWRLACLANDPERQKEAQSFCQALLSEDPGNPVVIVWAISRNYQVDLSISQKALETSIEKSGDSLNHITVLLWLYLNEEKPRDVLKLLDQKKDLFEQQGFTDYWIFWYAQALVANGNSSEALQATDTLKNPYAGRLLRTLVLREIAKQSEEWQPVVEHLETCFQESQDGKFLYECCQLKADLKDWAYVADRADALLDQIGTPAALELTVNCTWQAGRPAQCLRLLNNNQKLFSGGVLPNYLRHLKIWCLAQIGSTTQALAEAEALVRQEETTEYLLAWMDMQLRQGDMKGLAVTARRLAARKDIQQINLLMAAKWVQPEDEGLARKLWRQAVEKPVDNPQVLGAVIDIGYKLSFDRELRPFLRQAQLLALQGEGSFQAVQLKEVLSQRQSWLDQATLSNQKYEGGEIPIHLHLIVEVNKYPLVNLLQGLLQKNSAAPNPHCQASVFTRYGGRPVQTLPFPEEFAASCSQWQLHLDISAFLLAAHLEILDAVEQHFKSLKISPALQSALAHQRQMLLSHQPSRFNIHRQILELLKAGKLKEIPCQLDNLASAGELAEKKGQQWAALLEKAKAEGGYLVEFLPLTKMDDEGELQLVLLSESDRKRVINCRALLEALKQSKLLKNDQYQVALADLGDEGYPAPLPSLPQLNAPVFLIASTVDVLAGAKILSKICQHFRVFVDHSYVERTRAAIYENEQCLELVEWLTGLMERVRDGLDQGIYKEITLLDDRASRELEQEKEDNWDFITALDLFRFTAEYDDVIWIDDRFFNKYPHRDGVPIITILEVLDALLAGNQLSQEDYYDKLLQLRKANVRYIPITAQEIIHYLKQAQVIEGSVKETEELSVIRRYIASCLLDSHRLQLPPTPDGSPNFPGEVMFVLSCLRATEDAIIAGWLDEQLSEEYAVAYANWILTNLYTGTFGIRHLSPAPNPDSDGIDAVGLDIGSLYLRGIQLLRLNNNRSQEEPNWCQRYFQWIDWQITKARFRANPETVTLAVQAIHAFLANQSMAPQEDEIQAQVTKLIIQEFYQDLPQALRVGIESDLDLMKWLGIEIIQSVNISDLAFPATDFWQATSTALNQGEAALAALQPQVKLRLQKSSPENPSAKILAIRSEDNSTVKEIDDPLFWLLSDNRDLYEDVLRSHRIWFDCDNETFEQSVKEIAFLQEARTRFEKAKAWRDNSAACFYVVLKNHLNYTNQLSADKLIPPSGNGLLRHFRLNKVITDSSNFHIKLSSAAESLLASEGLEETLNRLVCLPVKLPHILLKALANLSAKQKQNVLHRLAARWASPVSKLHLVDLALDFSSNGSELIDIAQRTLDELFSKNGEAHFRLFRAILNLVNNQFSYWTEAKEWSAPIRIAMLWAHTSKLQNMLDVPGLDIEGFAQELEEYGQRRQLNADILNHNLEFWNDVLHPHRLTRMELVVNGLTAVVLDKPLELLNQLDVIDRVAAFAVKVREGQSIPDAQLLRDPILAQDSLGSLVGGDRAQSPLFETELGQYLASSRLKIMVEAVIQSFENNQLSRNHWLGLIAVVGDLPIYDDLRERLRNILENLDISLLFVADPSLAFLALEFASGQLAYIGDEQLRSRFEDRVIRLAESLAEQEKETNIDIDENTTAEFIENIFRFSIKAENPRETSRTAARLLAKILRAWPRLANTHLYSGISRFVHELPLQLLQGLWQVALCLRAAR